MIKLDFVGLMNQHLVFNTDDSNITSKNNNSIYNQIISGNYESPSFNYLCNLGTMRLNDVKSISMFNETNLAANINEIKPYEDIVSEDTIILSNKIPKIKKAISSVLEERHSVRKFSSYVEMSFEEFSTILKYSYGIAKRKVNYDEVTVSTRYYGSGGGLYPIAVYILVNKVAGVKAGVYRYQPYSHSLLSINNQIEVEKFLQYGSFDFENYSFCVLYEYDINKNYVKYGELALLTSFIEVGLMSQNFDLIATSLNFATCQIAGFDKVYAEKALGLDSVNSHIIYTSICGKE